MMSEHSNVTVLDLDTGYPGVTPAEAIAETAATLYGTPCYIAGSAVAADTYGLTGYGDLDVFTPSPQVLVSAVQLMLSSGYTLDDRFTRVWHRWLRHGFKSWHTNSIRLHSKLGVQVNVVYKLTNRQPTTSLAQVLESFDFGLLAVGLDVEDGTYRDMRSFLFPDHGPTDPLPLMPNKRSDWRQGFISQYNGLREAMRYAKYHQYGYDMSAVKSDLIEGYRQGAVYYLNHFDEDKQLLGQIYMLLAQRVEDDEVDELTESYKEINLTDSLDQIMEGLE